MPDASGVFRPWLRGIGAGGDATCGAFSDGSIGNTSLRARKEVKRQTAERKACGLKFKTVL